MGLEFFLQRVRRPTQIISGPGQSPGRRLHRDQAQYCDREEKEGNEYFNEGDALFLARRITHVPLQVLSLPRVKCHHPGIQFCVPILPGYTPLQYVFQILRRKGVYYLIGLFWKNLKD